jgi:recombination protein RecT
MTTEQALVKRPVDRLKMILSDAGVQEQFKNALQDNANAFVASIIDLYSSDASLQQCEPAALIMECLKAATLKLPINKQLGFAWVIPYKSKAGMTPQFQLGYKGYIQLAMRTGQYRYLNAGPVYEGIVIDQDLKSGKIEFLGDATGSEVQGYFAHLELLNGFSKTVYWPRERVAAHGRRYSKAFGYDSSPWKTDFDGMANKTMIRQLLSKFGILSIEMAQGIEADFDEAEEDRPPIMEPISLTETPAEEASLEADGAAA